MDALSIFKALADPIRFRIVAILEREPLSVGEICILLELKQSRISRHLGILASAGLLASHRSGANIYYWRSHHFYSQDSGLGFLRSIGLINGSRGFFEIPAQCDNDQRKLEEYLQTRQSRTLEYFQNQRDSARIEQETFVDSNFYFSELVNMLPPDSLVAADLGCGHGELSSRIASRLDELICIDQSQAMLDQAKRQPGLAGAEFRLGKLSHLPVRDGEIDLVIASMVLHHMPEPTLLLIEIGRVLQKKGMLLLAELKDHSEERMRTQYADFWLGFSSDQLDSWMQEYGFEIKKKASGFGNGKLESQIILAQLVN